MLLSVYCLIDSSFSKANVLLGAQDGQMVEQMQVTELESLAAAISARPREASMVAGSALGLTDGTEDDVAEALLSHMELEGGFDKGQVPTQATSSQLEF